MFVCAYKGIFCSEIIVDIGSYFAYMQIAQKVLPV